MSEHPDQYSRQHPGHSEPDRYLDDEGRCTFCGRSVWEETAKLAVEKGVDLEHQLAERVADWRGYSWPLIVDLEQERDHYKALAERRGEGRPTIVCLCGSTRFMDAFEEWGWKKTLDGEIVLSVGVARELPYDHGKKEEFLGEDVAAALDELHKRKIDLADYVFVLNVGGYIGDSTRSEIEYAEALGKRVDYLEARAALAATPEEEKR